MHGNACKLHDPNDRLRNGRCAACNRIHQKTYRTSLVESRHKLRRIEAAMAL